MPCCSYATLLPVQGEVSVYVLLVKFQESRWVATFCEMRLKTRELARSFPYACKNIVKFAVIYKDKKWFD